MLKFSARGKKAHWCLITGFLLLSDLPQDLNSNQTDSTLDLNSNQDQSSSLNDHSNSFKSQNSAQIKFIDSNEALFSPPSYKKLLLIARQSKSLVLGKFSFFVIKTCNPGYTF